MIILSHPTGNENVRAVALGLLRNHLLHRFQTCISVFNGDFLHSLGSLAPLSELKRRVFDTRLKQMTRMSPWTELGRIAAMKSGLSPLIAHEKGIFSIDAVYKNLDKKVASKIRKSDSNGIEGVYAYEDGALKTFAAAREAGLYCFYDLPIGYWRAARELLEEEKDCRPEWASTIVGHKDSEEKLRRKDEEIRLSHHIFVASSFTAQTLMKFPETLPPVQVIPYGFSSTGSPRTYDYHLKRRPLKILFVGSLTQRKGIAQLFEAVSSLNKHVVLTVIGRRIVNDCPVLNMALSNHSYIPSLSHDGILTKMRESDLLILPSLFEGFGLVITEAMSQGTPVITTARTAGADIIRHGNNGWIIEAGSSDSIREILEIIIHEPALIEKVGSAASATASERTWERYGNELAASVEKILLGPKMHNT